jgi:hypothetical protein
VAATLNRAAMKILEILFGALMARIDVWSYV